MSSKSNPTLDTAVVAHAAQAMADRLKVSVQELIHIGNMDNRPYGGTKCIALFNTPDGQTLAEDVSDEEA